MEKRKMAIIFMTVLILSASCTPTPVLLNETFPNATSNMTIPHNNRFLFLLPLFAPAVEALIGALSATAIGTAAASASILAGQAIKGAIDSSGHSGGSSSSSSSGSTGHAATDSQTFEQDITRLYQAVATEVTSGVGTLTALKSFKNRCGLDDVCVGAEPGLFGPELYVGKLVEKGKCPKLKDINGTDLTTTALFQIPPSSTCNEDCCLLNKNLLPSLICFEKATYSEGRCMLLCSNDKTELGDSVGCDDGYKCCGNHQAIVMG